MVWNIPKKKLRRGIDKYGRNELHYSSNLSDIKTLIKGGSNINLQDDNGWTPLHFYAQESNDETIKYLLELGANPNLLDLHGNGPLWTATMNARGNYACVILLLNAGAIPTHKNKHGRSPLDMANTIGNGLEVVFNQGAST